MSDKKSKKKQMQIAAVVGLLLAAGFFFYPLSDGRTMWQKVVPESWTNSKKPAGKAKGRYVRPPTGQPAVGTGGPIRGPESSPMHDITPREQSDLDRLIDRKLKRR